MTTYRVPSSAGCASGNVKRQPQWANWIFYWALFRSTNCRTHAVKTTKQITITQSKTRLRELQAKIQIKEGEKANQYVQEKLTSDPALKRS